MHDDLDTYLVDVEHYSRPQPTLTRPENQQCEFSTWESLLVRHMSQTWLSPVAHCRPDFTTSCRPQLTHANQRARRTHGALHHCRDGGKELNAHWLNHTVNPGVIGQILATKPIWWEQNCYINSLNRESLPYQFARTRARCSVWTQSTAVIAATVTSHGS
jgi:hypothetical protein